MIFIDTGAFLARYIERDQCHRQALVTWENFKKNQTPLATSNFVLDETFTLLGRRAGYRFAVDRAHAIYRSTRLTILRPGAEEEGSALLLFEKYADQKVSFTDCISFALMKKYRIKTAFSFDSHFRIGGFSITPDR